MIALDTHILTRLLLADDAAQLARVKTLLGKKQIYTAPITVMLELVWVLEANDCAAIDIERGMNLLLGLANFKPAHLEELKQALAWYAQGLDFADALHLALSGEAEKFMTFDKRFAKVAKKCNQIVLVSEA